MNDKYFKANQKMWDEFAKEHFHNESEFYSVNSFLEGKTTLKQYELNDIGSVKGKKLLHLQCHFGLDTLSWEREGAIVTGIDFSGEAIRLAKVLTEKANLSGKFIRSNLYDLPNVLSEKFDIIYTSIGVLCWLNDLRKWAEIIAHFLKPGGFFYIADGHPFSKMFDNEHPEELQLRYNYFHSAEPMEDTVEGSYASNKPHMKPLKEYEWEHSLSDIINSLIQAGLKIDFFNEHPYLPFQVYSFSEQDSNGYYKLKNQKAEIPLFFTLKASKI
ncbi:MAG: class I SAM-dependent methyltransferase [Candidatus Lokiarchaeota archaeon]|nr:class I SAM-dependent methyltransferase [Candidatus Lokiarchaeota archaeon]